MSMVRSNSTTANPRPAVPVISPPGRPRSRPGRDWVSKTALTRFLRCPYTFWMIDSGQITVEETLDEFHEDLIRTGQQFQEQVESEALPLPIPWQDIPLTKAWRILGTPFFANPGLKIWGRPDGVDLADGALIPVEVKSHRSVRLMDRLELAFYWLLLEPHRIRHDTSPQGWLILRQDGARKDVQVPIRPDHIERVIELLGQVREARQSGVRPRLCGCEVCKGIFLEPLLAQATKAQDPSLILGVRGRRAEILERLGYRRFDSLLEADPEILAQQFRDARSYGVTPGEIRRWQLHARSYLAKVPVLATGHAPFPIQGRFIALDLEYDSTYDDIWLIGLGLVETDDRRSYKFLWANDRRGQGRNLQRLATFLDKHPDIPVVTWSGTSAELPLLTRVGHRHRCEELLEPLLDRHVDLYEWTLQNVRFPFRDLGLKDLGAYYGIPRLSDIRGGRHAIALYNHYLGTRDQSLKDRLIDYNQEDLDALAGVAQALRTLAA